MQSGWKEFMRVLKIFFWRLREILNAGSRPVEGYSKRRFMQDFQTGELYVSLSLSGR